jgi:RND family efflux transporter MFP subunit
MIQTGYAKPLSESVTTANVETAHRFVTSLNWFGQVKSIRRITIPARVNGLIVSINVADETAVEQGMVLFTLAGKEVESSALNLQQQLKQATNEEATAGKNLQLKRNQRQQGLATNEQVNQAEQALFLAQAHVAAARQAVTNMHIGSKITASVRGVFTARTVHVGQYVSSGMILATIVDPDHVRIQATLFAPTGMRLEGEGALIHTPNGVLHATVATVMPERDPRGASQVWIEGSALKTLTPGMQLSGELKLTHTGMAVPASAIARDEMGESYLFVRDGDQLRKQPIRIGARDHDWVEVTGGVRGGEVVVTEGVYELLYQDFGKNYHAPD